MKKETPAKEHIKIDRYTPTEVGTMLESIHKEIRVVAEGHSGLDQRLENLEVEVHGNSRRLEMVELTCHVIKDKVGHLEDSVSKLNRDVTKLDSGLKETREELKETRQELKETREELKKEIHHLGDRLATVETRG